MIISNIALTIFLWLRSYEKDERETEWDTLLAFTKSQQRLELINGRDM